MNVIRNIAVAAMLLAGTAAYAQQQMMRKTPEERAQKQTMWMEQNVGISKEQSSKVYSIILDHARAADNTATMPRSRETSRARHDIMKDRDAALKNVLTGEQYQQYQTMMQEKKAKMQARRTGAME